MPCANKFSGTQVKLALYKILNCASTVSHAKFIVVDIAIGQNEEANYHFREEYTSVIHIYYPRLRSIIGRLPHTELQQQRTEFHSIPRIVERDKIWLQRTRKNLRK